MRGYSSLLMLVSVVMAGLQPQGLDEYCNWSTQSLSNLVWLFMCSKIQPASYSCKFIRRFMHITIWINSVVSIQVLM